MASNNRNVNELFRKPRRSKGTPFHAQRNYYTIGVLAVSGLMWGLYELWPESQKFKDSIRSGKFNYSDDVKLRIQQTQFGRDNAAYDQLLSKIVARQNEREGVGRPQPWYAKLFSDRVED